MRVRKHIFLFFIFAFVIIGLLLYWVFLGFSRQQEKGPGKGLVFPSTKIDGGRFLVGDIYEFTFPFRNASNRAIEITKVRSGCACADLAVMPKVVAPGKKGVVRGAIEFRNFIGTLSEHIYLHTKDGGLYTLVVNASISKRYYCVPPVLDFGDVYWDSVLEGKVEIRSADGTESPRLLGILPGHHAAADARISEETDERRTVSIVVKQMDIGSFRQNIIIQTGDSRQPQVVIAIRADVRGPITVEPSRLFLGSVSASKVICKRLLLQKRKGYKTEISTISTSKVPVTFKIVADPEQDDVTVDVVMDFSQLRGLVVDNMLIETSTPHFKTYVPIVAFVSENKSSDRAQ